MYREQIRVLDCTIRDGGLMNNHQFDTDFVRKVYKGVSASGMDYFEIGYKNSKRLFSSEEYGLWKFCDDADIRKVVDGVENGSKISVMVDIGRVDMEDIKPANESPVDMIRVASYAKDIDKAIKLVEHFHSLGYETTINVMAISRVLSNGLEEALRQVENESNVDAVYIVDSFGALYQETVEFLMEKYTSILKTKEVGVHMHNNQQLAFGNTIEGIIHGANYLDSTILGMGRAAGNCHTELLLGFLKNPKFDIRPILDLIAKQFVPLRKKVEWGYLIPYMITGMLDEHPRTAMALRKTDKKEEYREFYETMIGSDSDLD